MKRFFKREFLDTLIFIIGLLVTHFTMTAIKDASGKDSILQDTKVFLAFDFIFALILFLILYFVVEKLFKISL
jgi:hypothetical protein